MPDVGRVPEGTVPLPGVKLKMDTCVPIKFQDLRKEGTFVPLSPRNHGGATFRTPSDDTKRLQKGMNGSRSGLEPEGA